MFGALDRHRECDDGVDVGPRVGFVDPPAAAGVAGDGVGGVAGELRVVGHDEAAFDDGGVQACAGGNHARVVLGERDDGESFSVEFLGGLAEAPGVVDEFADVVAAGEVADEFDAFEDAFAAWMLEMVDGSPDRLAIVEVPPTDSDDELDQFEDATRRAFDLAKAQRPFLTASTISGANVATGARRILLALHEHEWVGGECVNGCRERRVVDDPREGAYGGRDSRKVPPRPLATARGRGPQEGEFLMSDNNPTRDSGSRAASPLRSPGVTMAGARVTGHVKLVQRKHGPVWYLKWRDATGRQMQRKLGPAHTGRGRPPAGHYTERTAKGALEGILTDARRGTLDAHHTTGATFADAAAEYLRYVANIRQREASTVTDYRSVINAYLLPEFGPVPLDAITADMIDAYKERLLAERRLGNRTIVRHLTVLHGIFRRAARVWGLQRNPASAELVERPPVRYSGEFTTLRPDEVQHLVRHAADEQDAALYLTAAFTGLRLGELRSCAGATWTSGCNAFTSAATTPTGRRRPRSLACAIRADGRRGNGRARPALTPRALHRPQ